MNENININYFKIDEKNKIKILFQNEIQQLYLSIYTLLESSKDDSIGSEINNFFNILIPSNGSDFLKINEEQKNIYKNLLKKLNLYSNLKKEEYIKECLLRLLNIEIKDGSFIFNNQNTEDLTILLCIIFKKLKKLKIKDFNNIIKELLYNMNLLHINFKENLNENSSIEMYKEFGKKIISQFNIPIEMACLINKFNKIIQLNFYMKNTNEKKRNENLFILLNLNWLFPNVIKIKLDFEDSNLLQNLNKIFEISFKSKDIKNSIDYKIFEKQNSLKNFSKNTKFEIFEEKININNISNINKCDSSSEKEINNSFINIENNQINLKESEKKNSFSKSVIIFFKNKDESNSSDLLNKYVISNIAYFETIIILCYFISKNINLKTISLFLQDSFSEEINLMLKSYNIIMPNFNYLLFLYKLENLSEFNIEFNSLNFKIFESILTIIYKNKNIEQLNISLFNDDEIYSLYYLLKLCRELKINIKILLEEQKKLLKNYNDIENNIVYFILHKKLCENFKINISKLLFILNYKKLKYLTICLKLPNIILNSDIYMTIIIKFIFNIFICLNQDNCLIKFTLIAPLIIFDNNQYPIINELFEEINLKDKKFLERLNINIGFYDCINICNIIPYNLKYLFLGDFDKISFKYFIDYYSSEEFLKKSQLISIKLKFNNSILVYEEIKDSIEKYIDNYPINLKEKMLFTKIGFLNDKNLVYLVNKILNINNKCDIIIQINKKFEFFLNQIYFDINNKQITYQILLFIYLAKKNKIKLMKKNDKILKIFYQFVYSTEINKHKIIIV